MAMGQKPVPPVNIPVRLPENGTIGFDPQPHVFLSSCCSVLAWGGKEQSVLAVRLGWFLFSERLGVSQMGLALQATKETGHRVRGGDSLTKHSMSDLWVRNGVGPKSETLLNSP